MEIVERGLADALRRKMELEGEIGKPESFVETTLKVLQFMDEWNQATQPRATRMFKAYELVIDDLEGLFIPEG